MSKETSKLNRISISTSIHDYMVSKIQADLSRTWNIKQNQEVPFSFFFYSDTDSTDTSAEGSPLSGLDCIMYYCC